MSERKPPEWHIEKTHPDFVKPLDEVFRQIHDPEIGLNIMELGLVRDVSINADKAHIVMIMTTPFCPFAPALLEAARSKAQSVLGMETTIEMGMDPWDPTYMEEGAGADWGLF